MRLLVTGIVLFVGGVETLHAQIREFPYEAIIDADDTEVHSGPGRKYYATSKLSRGSRVTVHRHDPGGWYMISPPADSFSLVRAEYVERQAGGRGVVKSANVSVRVGSNLNDSRDVWQRRLSTGDEVEIIEETTLQTPQGPTAMFKIKPPQGEYRWVSGRFVTPANKIARRQKDHDPFTIPTSVKRSHHKAAHDCKQPAAMTGELLESAELTGTDQKKSTNTVSDLERLQELDIQFRQIVRSGRDQWDFTELEQAYQQLKEQTADPTVAAQLENRFATLGQYQKTKAEYDNFMRLISETTRRDAELEALQHQGFAAFQPPQVVVPAGPASPAPQEPEIAQGPVIPPMHLGLSAPPGAPAHSHPPTHVSPPVPPSARPTTPPIPPHHHAHDRPGPRFDGAGIIQRSATTFPGAPRHVLLAPNGRILSYLKAAPGVNLDRFVGQSMGLKGRRWFRRDLQSDFMIVENMTPVHLTP